MVFEVHQPHRLDRRIPEKFLVKASRGSIDPRFVEEIIFDWSLDKLVIERVAKKCYIPATRIILESIREFRDSDRKFMVSFSVSGILVEQAKKWAPEFIELLRKAAATGLVEFIAQTYYHSVAFLIPPYYDELREQVEEHAKMLGEEFGYRPVTAESTEFTYNNDIACLFESMGFEVVLTEGHERVLGWRSPNYVYRSYLCDIRVLTRNYRLSDDVGFRFSDRNWDQYPLTADKYARWLRDTPGDLILLAMDYETFGEHHWPESGIHEFLRWLPREVLRYPELEFSTPRIAAFKYPVRDVVDVPPWATISWADERDVSAWAGNYLQHEALRAISELRPYVKALNDPQVTRLWKLLTISDHFYYMATKFGSIEEVHQYFSPYKNASIAHSIYMQAVVLLVSIIAEKLRSNREAVARLVVPDEKAFHFYRPFGEYTHMKARSLKELLESLERAPIDSIIYHLNRGDLQRWLREVMLLDELAEEFDKIAKAEIGGDELRRALINAAKRFLNMPT